MAAKPPKIVKGGFRATLALVISLVALIVSILTYTSTVREEGLKSQIKDLQATIESIKKESAEQLDRLRNETAITLEKVSNIIKEKKEVGEKPTRLNDNAKE